MTYFVKILAIVFLAFTVLGCANKNIAMGLAQGMFYIPPKCKNIEQYEKEVESLFTHVMFHGSICDISIETWNCIEQYKKSHPNKKITNKDCPI